MVHIVLQLTKFIRNTFFHPTYTSNGTSQVAQQIKSLPTIQETQADMSSIPRLGISPGRGNANQYSILAWRIPWTEEPGGLQSLGLQRAGHDWSDWACTYTQAMMSIFIHFYSNVFALQCCVSLCCAALWISYMCTYMPHSWASCPPPSPIHPFRSLQGTKLSTLCYRSASH